MPIQTPRLILRHLNEADFDQLRELDSDPAVLRYRSRKHISPEMTRDFLDQALGSIHAVPRALFAYAIVLKADLTWLGHCGLMALSPETADAFAWYSVLPRHWGHGYMTEALQALLYAGRTEFQLHRILAECHPGQPGLRSRHGKGRDAV